MSIELILLGINAASAAVKFGNKVDLVAARNEIFERGLPIVLPVPEATIPPKDELKAALEEFIAEPASDPALVSRAKELRNPFGARRTRDFLRIAMPGKFLPVIAPGTGAEHGFTEAEMHGVMLLESLREARAGREIFLLATEFTATVAAGFVPQLIGDKGVAKLVQGALTRFAVTSPDGEQLEGWSKDLARRALDAGIESVIANAGEFRGKEKTLDIAFDLLGALKGGMKEEDDWRSYAETFFTAGGFARFAGVLVKTGGERLANDASGPEAKFILSLTGDLSTVLAAAKGDSASYLRANWQEVVAGSLTAFVEHGEGLMPKQSDLLKALAKAGAGALAEVAGSGGKGGGDLARTLVSRMSASVLANPALLDKSIKDEGLQSLVLAVLGPFSKPAFGGSGLAAEVASGLAAGLLDLAANDAGLRGKVFSADASKWIGGIATELAKLGDDKLLAGIFDGKGRSEFGKALVTAALKTVSANAPELAGKANEEWLKVLLASFAGAAGGVDFEKAVGKQGLRSYLESAVALAAKHPALLAKTDGLEAALPVLLGAVQAGIGGKPIDRGELAGLLVEELGSWLARRGDVSGMDLRGFVQSLTKVLADKVRGGGKVEEGLVRDSLVAVTRALLARTDLNYLVQQEMLAEALSVLLGKKDLSSSQVVQAAGSIATHLLADMKEKELSKLAASGDAWKRLLAAAIEDGITAAVNGGGVSAPLFLNRLEGIFAEQLRRIVVS